MTSGHDPVPSTKGRESIFASPPGIILLGFLAVAGALLVAEHRAHIIFGAFIWGVLVVSLVLAALNGRSS